MGTVNTLEVIADHPAYAGHFPGAPVLPGVVLLDAMLRQIASANTTVATQWQIAAAKFHSPVSPGEGLLLEQESLPDGSLRFSIRTDTVSAARLVATGLLRPA